MGFCVQNEDFGVVFCCNIVVFRLWPQCGVVSARGDGCAVMVLGEIAVRTNCGLLRCEAGVLWLSGME